MQNHRFISFEKLRIEGFWRNKQEIINNVSIPGIYKRFSDTHRFDVLLPLWKKPFIKPHIFYDSDTAKWIEAAAEVLALHRAEYSELERQCDELIERFARLQRKNGYVNSFYQRFMLPTFVRRTDHELYCIGHIIEAAIAYKKATGKDKLLNVAKKSVENVINRFVKRKNTRFHTPGHEEIELALFRLFEESGEDKYRKLAEHFINERGRHSEDKTYPWNMKNYDQSDRPVRELSSAEGHAVRATYLYCGMADMARLNEDEELYAACKRLFDDISTKTYVTGGIGSTREGEAFTVSYDLPNITAYSESCAAIGLLLFCRRMLLIENRVDYADVVERIMYNNLLSSISLDGRAFFYENPLEIRLSEFSKYSHMKKHPYSLPITQRVEVFDCSCCPPNIARIIAAIGDNIFIEGEDVIYLQQLVGCTLATEKGELKITTDYPDSGTIGIRARGLEKRLAVRVPSWCKKYEVTENGTLANCKLDNGYLYFDKIDLDITLTLDVSPRYVYCNPLSSDNRNCVALCVGPVVYCVEGVDNGDLRGLAVDVNEPLVAERDERGYSRYVTTGYRLCSEKTYSDCPPTEEKRKLTFIPYYAFANRGESDMKVWLPLL